MSILNGHYPTSEEEAIKLIFNTMEIYSVINCCYCINKTSNKTTISFILDFPFYILTVVDPSR